MVFSPRIASSQPRLLCRSATAARNSPIITSLSGSKIYPTPVGSKLLPLLNPCDENIPFGMALELWDSTNTLEPYQCEIESFRSSVELYEVGYVICGTGKLVSSSGVSEILKAGDSVIMPYKGAKSYPVDEADDTPDWRFVLLRLILPSDLVSSPNKTFSECQVARDACYDWCTNQDDGRLTDTQACQLLQNMKSSVCDVPTIMTKDAFVKKITSSKEHRTSLNSDISKRCLEDLATFQLPNQTNRLALMFDPTEEEIPFTFGLEVFEPSHHTQPHVHDAAHELFFILSGRGVAFCDGQQIEVTAGDTIVFPPGCKHGIDNSHLSRMYCLELMLPNDMFAEFVKNGRPLGGLHDDDLCTLIAIGCK